MSNKLTIVCLTYNHEKFVAQTLDGFVIQKTDFPFSVLIADDCSTDRTPEIIMQYAEKYPHIIKPTYRERNIGPADNWIDMMARVKSDYCLYTDGDDYFSDPLKLQKQAYFLEANPEFSMCFHPVKVIYEGCEKPDEIFPEPDYRFNKDVLTIDDLLMHNFIQTNSVMYRWRFNGENIEEHFPKNILPGDWFLHLLHAEKGKIGFIDEVMSAYRRHCGGIFYDITNPETKDQFYIKCAIPHALFYKAVNARFPDKIPENFKRRAISTLKDSIRSFLKTKRFDKLKELYEVYPEYFDMSVNDMIEQVHNLVKENQLLRKSSL